MKSILASLMVICSATLVQAEPINIQVSLSEQKMYITTPTEVMVWKVSTGRKGLVTPTGNYVPERLVKMHYSKKYDNSPMPNTIFFRGGYAIHGGYTEASMGVPRSHGCVRLPTGKSAQLFNLVRDNSATIRITK